MRLSLTVVTKSSRNAVAGWVGDSVKVCVTAVPERGKANAASLILLRALSACPVINSESFLARNPDGRSLTQVASTSVRSRNGSRV